jgi:DNA-binding CsgD family transcriptional regulator
MRGLAMETLSLQDALNVNHSIGDIYTARSLDAFYSLMLAAIEDLIPGELCSRGEVDSLPDRFFNVTTANQQNGSSSRKLLPVFHARPEKHPSFRDTETQLSFSIPLMGDKVLLFTLSRENRFFSERDRLVLTLLRPHLVNALGNAMEHSRILLERDILQKGSESERKGAIQVQPDGVIKCISPFASTMLSKYFAAAFSEGDVLPCKLLHCFFRETNHSSFRQGKPHGISVLKIKAGWKHCKKVERGPLKVEGEGKNLTITLLCGVAAGYFHLVLAEVTPPKGHQNLAKYGLSLREKELLLLLSSGLTNVEIAIILKISKRTVEKHLENIFVKLGVGNRASAAMMVSK